MMFSDIVPFPFFLVIFFVGQSYSGINERHLINHLLGNYNPLERPVINSSETLNVVFGITLQQIIDVDEKNQMLISNLWLKFQWVDTNLKWNPEEYGGIENIRISTDRIWIPDVLMYNSADERFDSTFRTNVIVNHTGGCLYVPPGVFKSTCRIDITWFPFDDQFCELKFGSWSYDGLSVDLLQENVSADTSPYLPNGEWVLVDVPSIRTSQFYECCPGPFIDIKFIIHMKRRTLYYGFNLIIPCIILSSMTLLSFSLPPESGEKLHLGVTILLSMTVFLVQLSKILPATSDSISIIALYFGSVMVMVAVSVVMTVVVLNFHHRSSETKEMGPKLRKFLLDWLPRVLGMERPGIKPPKQCLKKASSKQKLVTTVFGCAHKSSDLSTNTEADILVVNTGNTKLDRKFNQPQVNSQHCTASPGRPLLSNDEMEDSPYCPPQHHPHLYLGPTPDGAIYEHENDCLYKTRDDKTSDSLTKTEKISEQNDVTCAEEDAEEEDDVCGIQMGDCMVDEDDEDLDMEVDIDLKSNKKSTTNEQHHHREEMNKQQQKHHHQEKEEDMLLNGEHYAKHKMMSIQRRQKLLEILVEMRFITDRLREEDQIKELISEWRYGATVLDRLCLILFTLFTLLSLTVCLISAPQLIV